jgi:hypothetical protein
MIGTVDWSRMAALIKGDDEDSLQILAALEGILYKYLCVKIIEDSISLHP